MDNIKRDGFPTSNNSSPLFMHVLYHKSALWMKWLRSSKTNEWVRLICITPIRIWQSTDSFILLLPPFHLTYTNAAAQSPPSHCLLLPPLPSFPESADSNLARCTVQCWPRARHNLQLMNYEFAESVIRIENQGSLKALAESYIDWVHYVVFEIKELTPNYLTSPYLTVNMKGCGKLRLFI